jgi:NodT family efflux transporter outer membrane factor (OMF) lipoprotein
MNWKSWSAGGLLLAITACATVGEDYAAPAMQLPESWPTQSPTELLAEETELADWWRRLNDPLLDELIERSTQHSLDLREALARLREARALRGVSAAGRFPTLDARATALRRSESDNTPLGAFVPDNTTYAAGFDAAWELDLWGQVARSIEAADAELAASVEDLRYVFVSVSAEVALNYIELRSFQRRLEIARSNVDLQQQTVDLVRGRFDAGLVGERDLAQALTNIESTRSRLPELEVGVAAAQNRLAVLLGEAPGALAAQLAMQSPIPVPPLSVAVGVPADLLRRRADVRQAERLLAAEHARIGVRESELYPRLTLNGDLGLASDDLGNLFSKDSGVFGFGPSLRWNIFDGGKSRQAVVAQEARTEQAQVRWERSVLVALEEAENAMTAFVRQQTRRSSLLEASSQANRAVELSRAQYREGLSDFQSVISSERDLAVLQDDLASSDASIATNFIVLY